MFMIDLAVISVDFDETFSIERYCRHNSYYS